MPLYTVVPSAATVSTDLITEFAAAPGCLRTRSRFARKMPIEPTACAPGAAGLPGPQRAPPADATAARSAGSLTSLEAPLTPTAPIRLPPNQAAAPRSYRDRMTVFRLLAMNVPLAGNAPADLTLDPPAAAGAPRRQRGC